MRGLGLALLTSTLLLAGCATGGGGGTSGCTSTRECPADQRCVDGRCVRPGEEDAGTTPRDSGVDAANGTDAGSSDSGAAPDAGPRDASVGDPCSNGVRDGSESDVDCGGACARCPDGRMCGGGTDCVGGVCTAGTCGAPAATCSNGSRDGSETDVDCGGDACPACDEGEMCSSFTDCTSSVCAAGTCAAPTCMDSVRNAAETDVDCGGEMCAACDAGESCVMPRDCATGVCTSGACAAPACSDGVRNGSETDVDCGGTCGGCAAGQMCGAPTDCATNECMGGVCVTCTTTSPMWSVGPACSGAFCSYNLNAIESTASNLLELDWRSFDECADCTETFTLSGATMTSSTNRCPELFGDQTFDSIRVGASASELELLWRGSESADCTKTITLDGATVSSSGACTGAFCGYRLDRIVAGAASNQLDLVWVSTDSCADCTETLTFAGVRTCE